eukprot:285186_1
MDDELETKNKWRNQRIDKLFKNRRSNDTHRKHRKSNSTNDLRYYKINAYLRACKQKYLSKDSKFYQNHSENIKRHDLRIESNINALKLLNITNSWNCSQCTFLNDNKSEYCSMCGHSYFYFHQTSQTTELTLNDFITSNNILHKISNHQNDNYAVQLAVELSLEISNRNYQCSHKSNNFFINENDLFLRMTNKNFGLMSADTERLFYEKPHLFILLEKLEILNIFSQAEGYCNNVRFVLKHRFINRLKLLLTNKNSKLIYVNYKEFPLLNNKLQHYSNYYNMHNDAVIKFASMELLLCGYFREGYNYKDIFIPDDILALLLKFFDVEPEQFLYQYDFNKSISYFKKRKCKIKYMDSVRAAAKWLQPKVVRFHGCFKNTYYPPWDRSKRVPVVDFNYRYCKLYVCLLLNNDKNAFYGNILPLLCVEKIKDVTV